MASANPFEQLTLDELRRRTSMKWRTHPADVLPLWVAEMDVAPAPAVVAAVGDALARGDTGYPAGTGYAEALRDFAVRRWGWHGIAVERTRLVPDVMLGAVEVLRLVTRPGGAVVVNCPVYPPFYAFVEHMDRHVVEAPLTTAGRLEPGALEAAFAIATRGGPAAYLLCNPHNPTGVAHTREELTAVAALAGRYGVRVVADEIHAPLVLPGARFTPYLDVPGGDAGFSLMSASKAFNLPGLKCAVAIAGADAADDLARMPEEVGHGPSHLGALAHTAALRDGDEWLDAVLCGLDANRRLLGDLLAAHLPAVGWVRPEATFLAWLDCTALGLDDPGADDADARGDVTASTGPAAAFLERGRVAVSAGAAFGTGGAGHVRLNFATSTAVLTRAVERMGKVAADGRTTERPYD
ncbi:aminotransferase class I/II-fold pyridoxal phosphate-dependent enzyme [Streptomyces sp. PTM05]|uniref:cysteine-S-conjugate beta-lyase n=1 Tax=Streptantibioticus parmotrematis TaxID=2873249 RepID=A0ABS7R2D5_9ACTN|nr:aminotransferase class I/II-fold pyridoxal phosphate-dependent enzyme [Streptantibioticus parmotrematis]MBY8888194.1 aminotransferase class I/II-fold pyridoxal phosphate-dependent enzyme [Streptantibioticus parmotrematis]